MYSILNEQGGAEQGGASMIQVIPTTGVSSTSHFGFTNWTRYRDVLYLSGISAVDEQGRIVGDDIETQTPKTYQNIEEVLRAAGFRAGSDSPDDELHR